MIEGEACHAPKPLQKRTLWTMVAGRTWTDRSDWDIWLALRQTVEVEGLYRHTKASPGVGIDGVGRVVKSYWGRQEVEANQQPAVLSTE